MQAGDYSKWGCIDLDIQTCHLFGHNKVARPSAPTPSGSKTRKVGSAGYCIKYNARHCMTNPCPWGRPHTFSTCSQGHPVTEHK